MKLNHSSASMPADSVFPNPPSMRPNRMCRLRHDYRLSLARLAILAAPAVFLAAGEGLGTAATLWDGPSLIFSEPAGASGSQPTNQDRITTGVWLTRNITQGLFNAAQESGYAHFFSPAGTAWAYGSLASFSSLGYTNWEAWNGRNPFSMVDRPAVVHLISEDIYFSVQFLSWGGPARGFSYERSTPSVPEPSSGAVALTGAILWACASRLRGRHCATLVCEPHNYPIQPRMDINRH